MNEDFENEILEREDEENSYYEKYGEYPTQITLSKSEKERVKKHLDEAIRMANELMK